MAIEKEIWRADIVKNLFADGSFAANSQNHSEYVNFKTVHVPNAGAAPNVEMDRSVFPSSISTRTDNDLYYQLHEFTSDAIRISNAEQVELSYNKRESVISASRAKITEDVESFVLQSWVPTGYTKVVTTGSNVVAHLADCTNNRKAVTIADILAVKKQFDKDNIPMAGRFAILDYEMMAQLLSALTENQYHAFLGSANAQTGVVGELYGFKFYQRSVALRTIAAGTSLATSNAATDAAAGLFWQRDCVSRALGNVEIFDRENDPTYYGDIVSALVRAGGSYCRYDKKGVVVLYQGTPV